MNNCSFYVVDTISNPFILKVKQGHQGHYS